jgi:two-component system NtrC family response regulator
MGRRPPRLAPALRREILGYRWPGNVREIRNHMERLVLLSPPESDVLENLALPSGTQARGGGVSVDFSGGPVSWETIERTVLSEALAAADGNISEAARLLGLGRGALRYRLARHDLDDRDQTTRKAA